MSAIKRIAAPPQRDSAVYKQLWRVVEGAVADAFVQHPDYLHGDASLDHAMRESITKRVVGNVLGFARERAKGGSAVEIGEECSFHFFLAGVGKRAPAMRSGVMVPHPAAPDPAQEG